MVVVLLGLVCLLQAAWIVYLDSRTTWQEQAVDNGVERGRAVAERMGCFACHGPGGTSPIANPGAAYGEVPEMESEFQRYVKRFAGWY